jgi:DNA-binding NarL/FixJ family response regulator
MSMAERAQAYVALDESDFARAAELCVSAAERARSVGASHEEGRSRILAGRALAAAGDEVQAVEQLETAARGFEATGAVRYRGQAERELRKLGRAVHRRTERPSAESGVGSLTGRELEIARLVVDRRTNPEIAQELFLSVKTVETHMRNIFRKLDVSSRVEVARVMEREAK